MSAKAKPKNQSPTRNKPRKDSKLRQLLEERLVKGEKIIARAHISSGIYWKAAAVFTLALVFSLFIVFELGVILAVFGFLMVIHAVLLKDILFLVVTNKRILARYGILQVDVVDIHFDKTESIELERMLPGYVLGYANVIILGTGNRAIVIPYVENAVQIRKAYNEQTLVSEEDREPQKEA